MLIQFPPHEKILYFRNEGLPLGTVSARYVHCVLSDSSAEDCDPELHSNRVSFLFFDTGVLMASGPVGCLAHCFLS